MPDFVSSDSRQVFRYAIPSDYCNAGLRGLLRVTTVASRPTATNSTDSGCNPNASRRPSPCTSADSDSDSGSGSNAITIAIASP